MLQRCSSTYVSLSEFSLACLDTVFVPKKVQQQACKMTLIEDSQEGESDRVHLLYKGQQLCWQRYWNRQLEA